MRTQGCHFYTKGLNFKTEISTRDYHSEILFSQRKYVRCGMKNNVSTTETQR